MEWAGMQALALSVPKHIRSDPKNGIYKQNR
jgi:hypothetical protein